MNTKACHKDTQAYLLNRTKTRIKMARRRVKMTQDKMVPILESISRWLITPEALDEVNFVVGDL